MKIKTLPNSDFTAHDNTLAKELQIVPPVKSQPIMKLKIVGDNRLEAGKRYEIKQINEAEAIIVTINKREQILRTIRFKFSMFLLSIRQMFDFSYCPKEKMGYNCRHRVYDNGTKECGK